MRLARTIQGQGRPLVIAHGLFGSARNWGVLAKRLSDTARVIGVDMRNHGDSPWSDDNGYPALAADLAETVEEEGAPADILGHSMGGKAAMMLALMRPDLVGRLVVVDIAPAAYGHSQKPFIEAMRAVDLARVTRRSEAAAQLAVEDPGIAAFLLQSLDLPGRRWRLNLDALAAEMDRIVGWPEVEGRFEGPVLFLRGGASDYVQDEHWPRIRSLFPQAELHTVPDAGHWLHAERPREVEAAVRGFLQADR